MLLEQLELKGWVICLLIVGFTDDIFNKNSFLRIFRLIFDCNKFLPKYCNITLILNIKPFNNNFQHFPILLNKRIPGHKAIYQRYLEKLAINVLKCMRSVGNTKIVQRWIEVKVDWREGLCRLRRVYDGLDGLLGV